MRPQLLSHVAILRLGPDQFLLQDRQADQFFELGAEERFLVGLFDGQNDDATICQRYQQRFGRQVSSRYLEEFVEQLRLNGLAVDLDNPADVRPGQQPFTARPRSETTPSAGAWSSGAGGTLSIAPPAPLSADDPQGVLNHRFDLLALLAGWSIHPLMLVPIVLLAFGGANVLVRHFWLLLEEGTYLREQFALPLLVLTWFGAAIACLGLPTALLKGMACRIYGGRVRSFELRFHRGLIPYFNCDVGEFFAARDKPGRWTALTMGIWWRLAAGSLALLGWTIAEPGSVLSSFFLILIGPSLLGLLLRLNPFVPLDGYAAAMYWLDEPRLYERATAETWAWLTLAPAPEALDNDERFWFRVYGTGVYLWKLLLLGVIVGAGGWLLTRELSGAGALLGLTLLAWWYHQEIGRNVMASRGLRWLVRGGGRWYIRWPIRLFVLAGLVACGFIPYNHEIGGDVRLVPAREVSIRAFTDGEIRELDLREGDPVNTDDVIARLGGRRQKAEVEMTQAQLEAAEARLKLLRAGNRPEEIEIAQNRLEMAERRLDYYLTEEQRIEGLVESKTVSQAELESARFNRDQAQKMLDTAREELAALTSGAREEEIVAAEAEVARLQAQLAHHKEELQLVEIRSPIAGQVATAHLEGRLGHYVERGDLIAVLHDPTVLQAEIAATEAAGVHIQPGQRVKIRLWGTDGELINGVVTRVAPVAVDAGELGVSRVRTDREARGQAALHHERKHYVRVYAQLEEPTANLLPEMTGYARIVVDEDIFWRALARPIVRFFRVEVWSWLP